MRWSRDRRSVRSAGALPGVACGAPRRLRSASAVAFDVAPSSRASSKESSGKGDGAREMRLGITSNRAGTAPTFSMVNVEETCSPRTTGPREGHRRLGPMAPTRARLEEEEVGERGLEERRVREDVRDEEVLALAEEAGADRDP